MADQYKSILKATSIFGGTQLIQVLITLIRSKFVAVIIGAEGMGLSAIYTSTIALVVTIFGFGMSSSVVRDISKAYANGDMNEVAKVITVFRRLVIYSAFGGASFVILSSKLLSKWSFNNDDYHLQFAFLSIMVFFNLLQAANNSLLVGTRRIRDVAKCSVISSFVNLLTAIPLFYFFGLDGIVPGFILSSIASYIIYWIHVHKIKLPKVTVVKTDMKYYAVSIITLGVAMVIKSLLANLTTYSINISISNIGNIADLGLYGAAMGITAQSIEIVFSSMTADYYPRLIASFSSRDERNKIVNQQTEIILYLAAPILSVMVMVSPLLVRILLAPEFLVINSFIRIICIGLLLKSVSYALGYMPLANADKKVFLVLEGGYANLMNIILSIGLYYLYGLSGLAYGFVISYICYYFVVFTVCKKRYSYASDNNTLVLILSLVIVLSLEVVLSFLLPTIPFYVTASILCLCVSIVCLKKLNERTGLISMLIIFKNRFYE